jgi:hypothetical protein
MNISKSYAEINFPNLHEKIITIISIKDENEYKNFHKEHYQHCISYLIPLKIYNSNTMKLLNYIINFKQSLWFNDGGNGGILVDDSTGIVMNHANEYFIHYDKQYPYTKHGTASEIPTIQSAIEFIKKRLASAIKEFLKLHSTIKIIQFKDPESPDKTLYFEKYYLDILYNFFKDNNLKNFFTEKQINEVIGENPKNQFLLSAIEVFRQEIMKIEEEKEKSNHEIMTERAMVMNEIQKKYRQKIDDNTKIYDDKIKEIQNQIKDFLIKN